MWLEKGHASHHALIRRYTRVLHREWRHDWTRRSRVVTFTAIRLGGPGFKRRPGQKFETRFLLHSHPNGGEGMSLVQGEAIRLRYIKLEYLYLWQNGVQRQKNTQTMTQRVSSRMRDMVNQNINYLWTTKGYPSIMHFDDAVYLFQGFLHLLQTLKT